LLHGAGPARKSSYPEKIFMTKIRRLFALFAIAMGLLISTFSAMGASQNLLVNGDSVSVGAGWTFNTTISPNPNANKYSAYSNFYWEYLEETPWGGIAPDGFNIAFVCGRVCDSGGSNSVSQKVNGLIYGNQYQLSFWERVYRVNSRRDYGPGDLDIPAPFEVKLGARTLVNMLGNYAYDTRFVPALRKDTVNFTYLENSSSAVLSFIQNFKPFFLGACVPCSQDDTFRLGGIFLEDVTPAAPKLTVTKALSGNRGANTDQFTVQILDGVKVVNSTTNSTTTGTGLTVDNGTGTTGPTTLTAGTSYKIMEVGSGATNLGGYSSTLACTNSTGTKVPTALNTAFTLSNTDTVSCTIANKVLPVTLALRQLVQKPVPINIGAPYTFSYTGNNGWTTQPVTNDSQATLASSPTQTLSAFNTATTLSAIMPARWSVSTFSCVDINAAASGNPPGELVKVLKLNTITIPAANVRPGANLRCTSMLSRLTP
jgi:hypothetical protein